MMIPKFTCFASEREISKDLTRARVHAIATKVIWSDYDCTAYEALREARRNNKQFRVFPVDSHEKAKALAEVLA